MSGTPPDAGEPDPLAFTPVLLARARHDGWSPDVQRAFIAALEETGVVSVAARSVGMSKASAYKLRNRPGAESFAKAWDFALTVARERAFGAAMHHMHHGETIPLFYRGSFIGTRRRHDHRLLMAALRAMDAHANLTGASGKVDR